MLIKYVDIYSSINNEKNKKYIYIINKIYFYFRLFFDYFLR